MPAIKPTFNPVIHPAVPTREINNARPIVVINIRTKEEMNKAPTPFFAFGSFTFTPDDLIHASRNNNEYHKAPNRKKATAATNTASQLMFEKIAVFMMLVLFRRLRRS